MSQDRKETLIAFRVTGDYSEKINRLCDKLGLSKSQTIRMMLDRGIEEFLDEKSSLSLVSDKQWNDLLTVRLEKFLETITRLTKDIKTVSGQTKKGDIINITEEQLGRWISEAIRDDRDFNVEDINPGAEKVKKAILTTVQKLRGRVE